MATLVEMATTPLSELPKLPTELAHGVATRPELKRVDTIEKNVLPSKEDLASERQHVEILTGIEKFSDGKLRHVETDEKQVLPSQNDIKTEKVHQELTHNIESFSPQKLRTVSTEEKQVLPSKEDIACEKIDILDIAREKTVDEVAHFNPKQLKHVEPAVKTGIEVITSS